MKKILSLSMIIFIGGMLFGQSAKYTKLINLAKQYEAQKQYIFALGTYYDAIEEDQINCTEAAEAYEKLSSLIASGKPGNGNFGKFELHDEWKKVLLDAERYWAENPIIGIKIKNVSQDSIDYNTKTANYKIEYNYYFTEKYKVIRNIIVSGCEKAGSKSWSDFPELSDWPRTSVLTVNDGSTDGIYKKYKIPLLKDSETNYHSPYFSTSVINFKKYEAKSWEELGFQSAIIEQMEALEINFIVNDVKFGVFDRNNKLLFSGTRQLVKKSKDTYSYIIQKVPQNIIKLIDNNQVEIKLAGFYIQYGVLAKKEIYIPSYNSYNRSSAKANFLKEVNDSLSDESLRSLVVKLPDISIDINKIENFEKKNAYSVAQEKQKAKKDAIATINKLLNDENYDQVLTQIEKSKSNGVNLSIEDFGLNNEELNKKVLIKKMKIAYSNKDYSRVENLIAYATSKGIKVSTQDINIASEEFERVKKNAQKKAYDDHKKSYSKNVFEVRKNFEEKYFVILPKTNILMAKTELTDFSINKPEVCKWITAIELCNFFSLMHGLEEAYIINGDEVIWNKDANGYRLPTEEEWIYAAKGGKNSKYSGGNGIDSVAWYIKNSNGVVNTPSTKDANKYGLYDMTGNVREWCWNDKVEAGEGFKVVKGGSFKSDPKLCEINFSDAVFKDSELDDVGFRMCRNITEKDKEVIGDACDPWNLMMNFSSEKGMGYYEVSQSLYESIVGSNPSHYIGKDKPVESVSWLDAIKFCNALSKAAGLDEVYLIDGEEIFWNKNAKGFRLPTAIEWYQAASGEEQYIYAGSENLDEIAWIKENSNGETHNRGEKKPNKCGFYDFNGNVKEWVWVEEELEKVGCMGGSYCESKDSSEFDIAVYKTEERNNAYWNVGIRLCRDI
ncbi:MAG: formylglycine-generating enzyme family protein [Treponema sp.]|uniref:formylglycine-generating enzyme family protein n=1 Tax=Treponema sp. TaxID=166 RepID=UPI00298DF944|nr:SUMF1/EgtB/PvdO family nonheme iron enzyme [Treponema sp.]MCQ2600766.1 formylglycine-generating enzyme family protein [Treponema sp.]